MRYRGLKQTLFEIITVGYEILDGRILNTNSKWMAERVTSMGGKVTRMVTVGDDVSEIASAVREALKRKADWILMSGGLGPTYDDVTVEGVAKALGRGLVLNREAVKMLEERYSKLAEEGVVESPELTPHRLKMATLPRGAKPLRNTVGSAPGVLVKAGKTRIACLPGVPKELYDIFERELQPIIERSIRRVYRVEESFMAVGVAESSIAPRIDEVRKRMPSVYIKSHPKTVEAGVSRIEFQVSAAANRRDVAEARARKARLLLERIVKEMGGEVREMGEGG